MNKTFFTLILVFIGFFSNQLQVSAQQRTSEEVQYLINNLLAQISSLQAILEERQKEGAVVNGTPSIKVTKPSQFMTVQYGKPFTLSWDAKNIPPSSKLLIDTKAALLYGGSGIGGGLYERILPAKSSSGSLTINTGVGYSDPGTYDVQAIVVSCADMLCTKPVISYDSVTGERIYLTKVLAKSDSVRYSITENAPLEFVGDGTITIGDITPSSGKFRLGEEMKISFYLFGNLKKDHEACFYLTSSTGGAFSPDSDTYESCAPAKVGLNVRTWTPFRKSGFELDPGLYKIRIEVPNLPNSSGKDFGNAAEKSGGWIELQPEA